MKNRKKMLLAGILLAAVMALPVFGAAPEPTQSGTTQLTAQKGSAYQLTIPSGIKTLSYATTDTDTELGSVSVSGNVNVGEIVTVSAVKYELVRKSSLTDTIPFTLLEKQTKAVFDTEVWNENEIRSGNKVLQLIVHVKGSDWNTAKAGEYNGSIVFSAALTSAD